MIDIDSALVVSAARLATEHSLPMTDALTQITAKRKKVLLWTQNAEFAERENVRYEHKRETKR